MNSASRAVELNRTCGCESVVAGGSADFYSQTPVFIGAGHARQMENLIAAIYRVVALPG